MERQEPIAHGLLPDQKMKKIIFLQPIVGLLDNIKSAPGLPLSLLTAAKFLTDEFEVKLIDQRLDRNWKETLKQELNDNVLFVGTTVMLGPEIEFAHEASQYVKSLKNVPVVWGGPFVSVLPEQALAEDCIDLVVVGDGEITSRELAKALRDNAPLDQIEGIIFKQDGKIIQNNPRPLVDFNQMPELPYQLVDVSKYLPRREGVPTIDMETSRGCPFNCRFCYNPAFNLRRWRWYEPELVLNRIKKLKEQYGIQGVWFVDDEFFIHPNRARKIIEGLMNLDLQWEIQGARADSLLALKDEDLELLVKSGCKQINIGAESGSNRILQMVEKRITTQQIIDVNRRLGKYDIMPWFYFMIGFPTETLEEQKMTINLVMRLLKENPKAKISGIGCFTPYPGTALFDDALKQGYKPPAKLLDWSTYAVDRINIPWLSGADRRRVETIQFSSFFIDQKPEDVADDWWIKLAAKLYRPFAQFRFKHHFYRLPLDAYIGNIIKKKLAQ